MARAKAAKPGTQVRGEQYRPGDIVWVGQSQGSRREGTIVRYLGEGSYSVLTTEGGVRSVDKGLLSLRKVDEEAGSQALEGLPAEDGRRATASEKSSLVERQRIRWYNPKLENFEWREAPKNDEEALSLLDLSPSCERYAEVYEEWRALGASIMAALIRAGEAAREESQDH